MIPNVQIVGAADTHPEKPVFDARQLASGQIDLMQLPIKESHVEVFDLMEKDDRARYTKLYKDLAPLVKAGKVFMTVNSREVLTRSDGSTGWFKYLEWIEFDTSEILGA